MYEYVAAGLEFYLRDRKEIFVIILSAPLFFIYSLRFSDIKKK